MCELERFGAENLASGVFLGHGILAGRSAWTVRPAVKSTMT